MNSGIVRQSTANEDLFSNQFYEYLRQNHEHLLVEYLEKDPPAFIVVPNSACLDSLSHFQTKKFAESHILLSAHIPGLLCSLRGNPVEFRNDRFIVTSEGTKHVSLVTSTESMYDFGHSFKVLVVDKPLLRSGSETQASANHVTINKTTVKTGGGPSEYLAAVPLIETDFIEKVSKLRKTFLLVPGYETHLAARIRDMSSIAASQVLRYLPPPCPVLEVVQQDIERAVYATLHAWIYPHIAQTVGERKVFTENVNRGDLTAILRQLGSPSVLTSNLPGIESAVKTEVCPILERMGVSVTPQQKINAITSAQERIGEILKTRLKIAAPGADEVIALLTVALVLGRVNQAVADLAYALMFLSAHEELSSSKAAFSVATFSSCVEFLNSAVL